MHPHRSHSVVSVSRRRRIKRNASCDSVISEDWRSPSFDTRSDSLSMNTIQENEETTCCSSSDDTVSEVMTLGSVITETNIADQEKTFKKSPIGGSTHKERITNLFFISLIVFIISFLLNAGLVSFGFWKLSKLQPNEAVISTFHISNLDQEEALFNLDASLPSRWYFRLFNLIIREGAQVKITFPDAFKAGKSSNSSSSLVSVKLPRLSFGRTGLQVNLKKVPLHINHNLSLQDLASYFAQIFRHATTSSLNVEVELQMTVETISYWVPIKFPFRSRKKINLMDLFKQSSTPNKPKLPFLEGVEFLDEKGSKQFGVKFLIGYPESLIPSFFSMDIPEMFFDVGYNTGEQKEALSENSFVEVKMSPHKVGKHETTTSSDRFLTISTMTDKDRIDAMTNLLGKIRDDEWDWSLVVGAHQRRKDSASFLQRWLTTFQMELTIKDLKRLINSSTKRLQKRSTAKKEEVLSIGLVAIDNRGEYPKVVTKVTCDNEFLSRFLFGIDVNRVKGTLPPVKVQSVVEKTPYDSGTTVCIIDLVHQPPRDKSKTSFIIKTEIADVTPFVRAIHRLAKANSLNSLMEVLGEYRTFTVEVVGDRILDTLIKEIEMEFTFVNGGGLFFRHGSKREIPLSFGDGEVDSRPVRPVKHDFRMEVLTDENSIRSIGKLQFPAKPAFQSSFVHIYWNSMDISLYPFRTENADNIELARFSVRKGSAQILLAPTNPLQMPFSGCFEYVLSIRDGGSTTKNVPSIIYAWKQVVQNYVNGTSQIQLVGRMGEKKIQFPITLPSMSVFFAEEDDQDAINEVIEQKLPRWLTDVIKTRVKIAGFRETMLHFLLELPAIGSCTAIANNEWLTALSIKIAFPPVTLNGCVYPKDKRGDESISCLAQVGLLPMYLSLDVVDGKFCDIRTHLANPLNSPININSKEDKDSQYKFTSLDKASAEGEALINFIPLRAAITNFRSLLETVDDVIANKRRKMKVSLGVGQKSDLLSKEINLLNKVVNGIGQSFPLLLPLYSNRPRPRSRPPVDHLYIKDHLSVFVDVESETSTDMKGRVVFELPKECITSDKKGKKETSPSNRGALAVLLSVQWGRTLFKATFQNSWLQLRFSQGQLTFRFDNDRVLLNRSHEAANTGMIVMEFALHADTPNFSSATLRRVLNHMNDFFSRFRGSNQSRNLLERLPKSKLRLEVSSEPYRSKKEIIYLRRRPIPSTNVDPKYHYKQDLSLSTVLEFSARAWKRYKATQKRVNANNRSSKPKNNLAVVIRPKGHPSIRKYKLPCIIPRICSENMQYSRLQDGPAVQAQVSIYNAIQPIMNMAALWIGALMDKLKLYRYPKYLAVAVRTSEINLALCINDIDVFEICVKPLSVKRVIPLVYPELPSAHVRGQPKVVDVEHIMVDVGLGKKPGLFGNLLAPYTLDMTFSPTPDPVPTVKLGRKTIHPHYSPLNVAFSTERIMRATMLSTFASLVIRETAAGFIPAGPFKGNTVMELVYTCRDRMELLLKDLNLKNPISFAAIYIDEPSTFHYYYKGFEFIRVNLNKFALVPGNNFLNAHVIVSRTAFGAKPEAASSFFPEFSEFLSGLQLGSPIAVKAVVRLGNVKFMMDMTFPKRPSNTGAFNAELSGFDWRDVHVISRFFADKLPAKTFSVSKTAARKLSSAYNAAKSMSSDIYNYAASPWQWFKDGNTIDGAGIASKIKRGFTNKVAALNRLYNRFSKGKKDRNRDRPEEAREVDENIPLNQNLLEVNDNIVIAEEAGENKPSLFENFNVLGSVKNAASYGVQAVKSISRKITGDENNESIFGGIKRGMTTLVNRVRSGQQKKQVRFEEDNTPFSDYAEEETDDELPEGLLLPEAFEEEERYDNINEIRPTSFFPNIFAEASSAIGKKKSAPAKAGYFSSFKALMFGNKQQESVTEEVNPQTEINEEFVNEAIPKTQRNWVMRTLFRDPDAPIVPLEFSSDSETGDESEDDFQSSEEDLPDNENIVAGEEDDNEDFEQIFYDVEDEGNEIIQSSSAIEEEKEFVDVISEDSQDSALEFLFKLAVESGKDITFVKDGIVYEINLRKVIDFLQEDINQKSKIVSGQEIFHLNNKKSQKPVNKGSWKSWITFWKRNRNVPNTTENNAAKGSVYQTVRRFVTHYLRWKKQKTPIIVTETKQDSPNILLIEPSNKIQGGFADVEGIVSVREYVKTPSQDSPVNIITIRKADGNTQKARKSSLEKPRTDNPARNVDPNPTLSRPVLENFSNSKVSQNVKACVGDCDNRDENLESINTINITSNPVGEDEVRVSDSELNDQIPTAVIDLHDRKEEDIEEQGQFVDEVMEDSEQISINVEGDNINNIFVSSNVMGKVKYFDALAEDTEASPLELLFKLALENGKDIAYTRDGLIYEIKMRKVFDFIKDNPWKFSTKIHQSSDRAVKVHQLNNNNEQSPKPVNEGSWKSWVPFWRGNKEKLNASTSAESKSSKGSIFRSVTGFFGKYLHRNKQKSPIKEPRETVPKILLEFSNDNREECIKAERLADILASNESVETPRDGSAPNVIKITNNERNTGKLDVALKNSKNKNGRINVDPTSSKPILDEASKRGVSTPFKAENENQIEDPISNNIDIHISPALGNKAISESESEEQDKKEESEEDEGNEDFEKMFYNVKSDKGHENIISSNVIEEEEEFVGEVAEESPLELLYKKALESGEDLVYVKDGIRYHVNLKEAIDFFPDDALSAVDQNSNEISEQEDVQGNNNKSSKSENGGSWKSWVPFLRRNKQESNNPNPAENKASKGSLYQSVRGFLGHYLRRNKWKSPVIVKENNKLDPLGNIPESQSNAQLSVTSNNREIRGNIASTLSSLVLSNVAGNMPNDPKNFVRRSNDGAWKENSRNTIENRIVENVENEISHEEELEVMRSEDSEYLSDFSVGSVEENHQIPRIPQSVKHSSPDFQESLSDYFPEVENRRRRRVPNYAISSLSEIEDPIVVPKRTKTIKKTRRDTLFEDDHGQIYSSLGSEEEYDEDEDILRLNEGMVGQNETDNIIIIERPLNDATPDSDINSDRGNRRTRQNGNIHHDVERNNESNEEEEQSESLELGADDVFEHLLRGELNHEISNNNHRNQSRRRGRQNATNLQASERKNESSEEEGQSEFVEVREDGREHGESDDDPNVQYMSVEEGSFEQSAEASEESTPLIYQEDNPYLQRDRHLEMGDFVNALTHGRHNSFEVNTGRRREDRVRPINIHRPNMHRQISKLWRQRLFIAASADRRERNASPLPPLKRTAYNPLPVPVLPPAAIENPTPSNLDRLGNLLSMSKKVIFHMAFRNSFDFNLYITAVILNMKVIDPTGKLHSKKAKFLQYMAGPPQGEPGLRIIFAPSDCQRFDISEGDLLECSRAHINESPGILGPRQSHQSMAEGIPAEAHLTHMSVLPLLADQFIHRDGICLEVKPSLVTVACGPSDPLPGQEPFFMEILMVLENQPKANSPFSDPCQFSISCLPSPEMELFERFKTFSHEDYLDNTTVQSIRQWSKTKLSVHSNLSVRFNVKLDGAMPAGSAQHRFGWAVVFTAGRIQKIDSASSYGFAGLRNSIAIVCNMKDGTMAVHLDGSSTPTMIKKTAAFPPGISSKKDFQVRILSGPSNNRSKERQIVIITSLVKYPQYRYVTVFPVDLREEILTFGADKMNVGLTYSSLNGSKPIFSHFSISTPLPDLLKSRIYHIDGQSARAHEKGRFLVELRDSCDRIIPKTMAGLRVMLKPVDHEDNDLADADDSLFSPPERNPVIANVTHIPKSDVYLVTYRIHVPGRYHIYVSFNKKPRLAEGLAPKLKWHRVSRQNIYVRNFW